MSLVVRFRGTAREVQEDIKYPQFYSKKSCKKVCIIQYFLYLCIIVKTTTI